MTFKVNTEKGWTEAIIDDDCEFDKFYKISTLMEIKLHISFSEKLSDFDTLYWDFIFNDSNLTLFYNIYEGVTVFPTAFKDANRKDNETVLLIANLVIKELSQYNWVNYDLGKTIGTRGSENGIIIADFENLSGSRITLEKDCGDIPFAITLGIYGLMFHTHYASSLDKAEFFLEVSKFKINKIFEMYDVPKERQSEYWQIKHNKLIEDLAEITS